MQIAGDGKTDKESLTICLPVPIFILMHQLLPMRQGIGPDGLLI